MPKFYAQEVVAECEDYWYLRRELAEKYNIPGDGDIVEIEACEFAAETWALYCAPRPAPATVAEAVAAAEAAEAALQREELAAEVWSAAAVAADDALRVIAREEAAADSAAAAAADIRAAARLRSRRRDAAARALNRARSALERARNPAPSGGVNYAAAL